MFQIYAVRIRSKCVLICLFVFDTAIRLVPESFRWYAAHDRHHDAEKIVRHVANVNGKTLHSTEHILRKPNTTKSTTKKHTILDMFSSKKLIIVTVLSALNWYAVCFLMFFSKRLNPCFVYLLLFLLQHTVN